MSVSAAPPLAASPVSDAPSSPTPAPVDTTATPVARPFPTLGEALLDLPRGTEQPEPADAADGADGAPAAPTGDAAGTTPRGPGGRFVAAGADEQPGAAANATPAEPVAANNAASPEATAARGEPEAGAPAVTAAPEPPKTREQIIAEYEAERRTTEAQATEQAQRAAVFTKYTGPQPEYDDLSRRAKRGEVLNYADQEKLAAWDANREMVNELGALITQDAHERVATETTRGLFGALARQLKPLADLPEVSADAIRASADFGVIGRHLYDSGARAAEARVRAELEPKLQKAEAQAAEQKQKLAERDAHLKSTSAALAGHAPQLEVGGTPPAGSPKQGASWDPTRSYRSNLAAALGF